MIVTAIAVKKFHATFFYFTDVFAKIKERDEDGKHEE